jgi:hypothetical protein
MQRSIIEHSKEMSYQARKRNPKCVLLSEKSQSEKTIYHMIPIVLDLLLHQPL